MPPLIVLTTDFGLTDAYVGVMKGVILGVNPQAAIVDLTHAIAPQDIRQGAFVLGASFRHFPPDAIHVAVVDPGVGTSRGALLLATPDGRFLAPDNGLLSGVLAGYMPDPPAAPGQAPVPPGCAAYRLANPRYWRQPVSRTFHGRDVFAPAAAWLSRGVPPAELGEPVTQVAWLPQPKPRQEASHVMGQVIHVDRFGNLITNIPESALAGAAAAQISVKGQTIPRLSQTFQDGAAPGELLALTGSYGLLEIAVRNGDAAALLGAGVGDAVAVIW